MICDRGSAGLKCLKNSFWYIDGSLFQGKGVMTTYWLLGEEGETFKEEEIEEEEEEGDEGEDEMEEESIMNSVLIDVLSPQV